MHKRNSTPQDWKHLAGFKPPLRIDQPGAALDHGVPAVLYCMSHLEIECTPATCINRITLIMELYLLIVSVFSPFHSAFTDCSH